MGIKPKDNFVGTLVGRYGEPAVGWLTGGRSALLRTLDVLQLSASQNYRVVRKMGSAGYLPDGVSGIDGSRGVSFRLAGRRAYCRLLWAKE